jgi:hypothetical protein
MDWMHLVHSVHRVHYGAVRLVPLVLVLWVLALALPLRAHPHTLQEVLDAAAAYVERYEAELSALVAEERYSQRVYIPRRRGVSRRLESQFLFLRLPGTNEWLGFRDVHAVDGRPVRPRDDRLASLLIDPSADVLQRARAIVGESARYNLGRQDHTVNVPTLVLDWVTPRVRPRLVFQSRGEDRVRGVKTVRVDFTEVTHPTLVRTPQGADVLSNGSFWIEPASGRILETELVSRLHHIVATVHVKYEREPRFNVLVPVEMREKLRIPPYDVEGTAKYNNFRRFEAIARIK